jgi:hypothetical protein
VTILSSPDACRKYAGTDITRVAETLTICFGDHFHKYWFRVQPASTAEAAMFMPFSLEPQDPEDGTPYEKVLTDHMQSVIYRLGNLFYRIGCQNANANTRALTAHASAPTSSAHTAAGDAGAAACGVATP